MQRKRESGRSSKRFDDFGGFGMHRETMSSFLRGRDPFADPFFSSPFDNNLFGSSSSMFNSSGDSPMETSSKGPLIEELYSDDDGEEDENNYINVGDKQDQSRKTKIVHKNPLIQHPEDQAEEKKITDVARTSGYNTERMAQSVSFQRVTYGGINGAYYSSATTRKMGSDGVILEESKQADKTTGEATHRISRGIHDKGHSVTRNLDSDGKVETMQTLHNMNEDEFANFERAWKGKADRHFPGWKDGIDLHGNSGGVGGRQEITPWQLPFKETSGGTGAKPHTTARATSSGGRPKKVVIINIE